MDFDYAYRKGYVDDFTIPWGKKTYAKLNVPSHKKLKWSREGSSEVFKHLTNKIQLHEN